MTTISEMSKEIKASMAIIEAQKNAIRELSEQISAQIGTEYPLKKFIGNDSVFHRVKWGYITGRAVPLTDLMIKQKKHLKPHNLFNGNELNEQYDTLFFKPESTYLLYVDFEADFDQDENGILPVYEFLAVKID